MQEQSKGLLNSDDWWVNNTVNRFLRVKGLFLQFCFPFNTWHNAQDIKKKKSIFFEFVYPALIFVLKHPVLNSANAACGSMLVKVNCTNSRTLIHSTIQCDSDAWSVQHFGIKAWILLRGETGTQTGNCGAAPHQETIPDNWLTPEATKTPWNLELLVLCFITISITLACCKTRITINLNKLNLHF